ncbi:MAG: hypothetical protein KJO49_04705 [Bacteroidia bacterium]|nr:hypothetical protein [Bacteroidia bacterium]NNK70484.1 hypothetical protein [Flavobacteriaceae bacterium]NNL79995.1 hypothetical protein [Flavobacteriaceae bacterium]
MQQDPVNYWEQFERLERLIKASELKAGLIFSFHGLILGLFFDRLNSFQDLFSESYLFIIFTGLWIIFVIISIYYAIKCFIPKMELKYDTNVFFFGDIVHEFDDVKSFSREFIKTCGDEELLYQQLSEQIHAESKIIDYKFRCVKNSLKYMSVSLILIVPILILILKHIL